MEHHYNRVNYLWCTVLLLFLLQPLNLSIQAGDGADIGCDAGQVSLPATVRSIKMQHRIIPSYQDYNNEMKEYTETTEVASSIANDLVILHIPDLNEESCN